MFLIYAHDRYLFHFLNHRPCRLYSLNASWSVHFRGPFYFPQEVYKTHKVVLKIDIDSNLLFDAINIFAVPKMQRCFTVRPPLGLGSLRKAGVPTCKGELKREQWWGT